MNVNIAQLLKQGSYVHDPARGVNGKIVSKSKVEDEIYGRPYYYFEFGIVWDDNLSKMITYEDTDMEDFLIVSGGKIIENKIY